jgi:hypothetical protein
MVFLDTAMAFIFPENRLPMPEEVLKEIRNYRKTASFSAAARYG